MKFVIYFDSKEKEEDINLKSFISSSILRFLRE